MEKIMEELMESNVKFLLEENDELEARVGNLETEIKMLKQALGVAKSESRKPRFWNRKVRNLL